MKSYLVVFNEELADRDTVTGFLDKIPEIVNWRSDMSGCVVVVSNLSAQEISQRLAELKDKDDGSQKGFYLVSEVSANKQGWLPKAAWRMMNEKHLPGA